MFVRTFISNRRAVRIFYGTSIMEDDVMDLLLVVIVLIGMFESFTKKVS